MITDKGTLDPVDVLGTDTVIPDMQREIEGLRDRLAALEAKPIRFERIPNNGTTNACQVIRDLQICWGMIEATAVDQHTFGQDFTFAAPFEMPPRLCTALWVSPLRIKYGAYSTVTLGAETTQPKAAEKFKAFQAPEIEVLERTYSQLT